jgi:hypothetical protein
VVDVEDWPDATVVDMVDGPDAELRASGSAASTTSGWVR